jgi:DNA polymerase III subunit gamma/tau
VSAEQAVARWSSDVVPTLKPLVRAIYSVPRVLGVRDGVLTLAVPNDTHRSKCEQFRADAETALVAVVGARVPLAFVIDATHDDEPPRGAVTASAAAPAAPAPVEADDDVDLDDLVDVPPESVVSPIDRLAQAFPGSEMIDERR